MPWPPKIEGVTVLGTVSDQLTTKVSCSSQDPSPNLKPDALTPKPPLAPISIVVLAKG